MQTHTSYLKLQTKKLQFLPNILLKKTGCWARIVLLLPILPIVDDKYVSQYTRHTY